MRKEKMKCATHPDGGTKNFKAKAYPQISGNVNITIGGKTAPSHMWEKTVAIGCQKCWTEFIERVCRSMRLI